MRVRTSDLSFHHDVGTDIGLVPHVTSAHESGSFVEGTSRRPGAAPEQTAAVQLDVVDNCTQQRGADALAPLVFGGRHSSKPPGAFIGSGPRRCLPPHDRSTDDAAVIECGEVSRVGVVRRGRERVRRLVWTQHSLPQRKRLCGRDALNRDARAQRRRSEKRRA